MDPKEDNAEDEKLKIRNHVIDGLIISDLFPPEAIRYTMNYLPHDEDIILATYPKCGTTWAQYIIYLLGNDGKPLPEGKLLHKEIPFMEFEGKEIERFPPPRMVKTHIPANLLKISSKAKYVCVLRNPRDCCVSYYYHHIGFIEDYGFEGTFDQFFEYFIRGEIDYNDYFDHVLSWLPYKGNENFLFLIYEEMKANPSEAVRKIADFLGGRFQKTLEKPGMVENILELCSFKAMKAREKEMQYEQTGPSTFFRKGVIGDWKSHFKEDQLKRLEERFKEKTKGTEIYEMWKRF